MRESVIILNWADLPDEVRTQIRQHPAFGGIYLEHLSEQPLSDDETWQDVLTEESFRACYVDQCSTKGYSKSFEEFLAEFGLTLDWWLKDQPIDFTGIRRILIRMVD